MSQSEADIAHFFGPSAPIQTVSGHLPHWRQDRAIYFVTFRLADSLPSDRLAQWRSERDTYLAHSPKPWTNEQQAEYDRQFSARIDQWLDRGFGYCILAEPRCCAIVTSAIGFFDGSRYTLGEFVVASNHVHAVVCPLGEFSLSSILHSWKSFTAKEIGKVVNVSDGSDELVGADELAGGSGTCGAPATQTIWQKESYDHIVRSPEALYRIESYIRAHVGFRERGP